MLGRVLGMRAHSLTLFRQRVQEREQIRLSKIIRVWAMNVRESFLITVIAVCFNVVQLANAAEFQKSTL
jgi:hypothetical protein